MIYYHDYHLYKMLVRCSRYDGGQTRIILADHVHMEEIADKFFEVMGYHPDWIEAVPISDEYFDLIESKFRERNLLVEN